MTVNPTQGTLLKVSISSVFTTVGQRISIKPNEKSRNEIETTDLDSNDDTSLPGIRRGGELELTVNLDLSLANQAYLETSFAAGNVELWKLVLANGTASTDAFSAWIKSRKIGDAEVDKKQEATYKLKLTGSSTLTP